MTGWIEDVRKLIDDIKDIAKNPKSHFSYAKDHGIAVCWRKDRFEGARLTSSGCSCGLESA